MEFNYYMTRQARNIARGSKAKGGAWGRGQSLRKPSGICVLIEACVNCEYL